MGPNLKRREPEAAYFFAGLGGSSQMHVRLVIGRMGVGGGGDNILS